MFFGDIVYQYFFQVFASSKNGKRLKNDLDLKNELGWNNEIGIKNELGLNNEMGLKNEIGIKDELGLMNELGLNNELILPQEWLDDRKYGTAFLSHNSLYLLDGKNILKSHIPTERIHSVGRKTIISATFVSGMLISISEDNSVNVFATHGYKHKGQFRLLFCLGIICPECGKVFRGANNFMKHMPMHTKAYRQCPKCPPGSSKMNNFKLRKHMKLCVIMCSYSGCGQICQTRARLKVHERKHKRYE